MDNNQTGVSLNDLMALLNIPDADIITMDVLQRLLAEKELEMKRKEILEQYPIKQLPDHDGRFWVRINGKTIMSVNKQRLEDKIVKLAKQTDTDRKNATIETIWENYFAIRKLSVAETTWVNDLRYRRLFLEDSKIFKKPLCKITLDDAYSFFNHTIEKKKKLAEDASSGVTSGMTREYWANVRGFMASIMKYAVNERYTDYNPFKGMVVHQDSFIPTKHTPKEDAVFSDDEIYKVCALAEKDQERTGEALPLGIPLFFQIGVRDGELVAIKWGDINGKWLFVHSELSGVVDEEGFVRGRCIKPRTKTICSTRDIELSKDAQTLFARIREINKASGYPTGRDDFVFYRTYKGCITTCTERCFAGRLEKYCKQAHMPVLKSPHDARRTCFTNMYKNGVPLSYIQAFAGHEDQKQTEAYLKLNIRDLAHNDNTSCLNMDTDKLEAYKNADYSKKIVPMPKRA